MNGDAILARAADDSSRSLALYRNLLQVRSVWGDAPELRRAAELLGAELRDAGLTVLPGHDSGVLSPGVVTAL